jgi:hypothetical protein
MLIKLYRNVYFFLLHRSVQGNLKKAIDKGASRIFVYERASTPCGKMLLSFVRDVDCVIGGLSIIGLIRYIFGPKLIFSADHTIITGNPYSSFIKGAKYIIEIQHGYLDQSYFQQATPNEFWARSNASLAYYKRMRPNVDVLRASDDLNLPEYDLEVIPPSIDVEFYSKNPGGNITRNQLVKLEQKVLSVFENVCLILHPRDNLLKLMLRHKCKLEILRVYFSSKFKNTNGRKLVISSYSTALIDKAKPNDLVLNVDVKGSGCMVQRELYSAIPRVDIEDISFMLHKEGLTVGRVQ